MWAVLRQDLHLAWHVLPLLLIRGAQNTRLPREACSSLSKYVNAYYVPGLLCAGAAFRLLANTARNKREERNTPAPALHVHLKEILLLLSFLDSYMLEHVLRVQ